MARQGPTLVVLTHVVKQGESLSKIALVHGQPVASWKELFELNREALRREQEKRGVLEADEEGKTPEPNPNLIYPGMVLRLPRTWSKTPEAEPVEVRLSDEGRRVAWVLGSAFVATVLLISAFSRRKKMRLREEVRDSHRRESTIAAAPPPPPASFPESTRTPIPGQLADLDVA